MAGQKAKTAAGGGRLMPKKHYCPEHDAPLQGVKVGNRKMRYRCGQGCDLSKKQAVLK